MPGDARRFGIDNDPEREARFRRIEQELDLRQLSNAQVGESAQTRSRLSPPQVTGISLVNKVIGGITVKWASVNSPDIRRYDIQVADNAAFNAPTTYKTTEPIFTFSEGDATSTYYVRVRALNSYGQPGPWSGSLNTTTGNANFDNLTSGAASNINFVTLDASELAAIHAPLIEGDLITYVDESITFPASTDVLIFAFAKASFTLDPAGGSFTASIQVDGAEIQEYESINSHASEATIGTLTVPGLGFPVEIQDAGVHTFKFILSVTGATTSLTPLIIDMAIVELRR